MKQKLIEVLMTLATAAILLGGYHVYNIMKAHYAMDEALLAIVKNQAPKAPEAP